MRLFYRVLLGLLVAVAMGLGLVIYFVANPKLPAYQPVQQLHYLDQWSPAERQTYYYTPRALRLKACITTGSAPWSCRFPNNPSRPPSTWRASAFWWTPSSRPVLPTRVTCQ